MPKTDATVKLIGADGNAFNLLGLARNALRKAEVPKEDIAAFMEEAQSGDYDHLLNTIMDWMELE